MQNMTKQHPGPWLLPGDDGDPSYGMGKEGLAAQDKKYHSIHSLKHPTTRLDLNPMEGI